MKILALTDAAQALAKALGKPVLYISFVTESFAEIELAAPYLAGDDAMQVMADEHGFIVCDTPEEMYALFDRTVGDDGPTEANPYAGPGNVYALEINADGTTRRENT